MGNENNFFNNIAFQLLKSILELNKENIGSLEIIESIIMGIYMKGYRDANMEKLVVPRSKLNNEELLKQWGCGVK